MVGNFHRYFLKGNQRFIWMGEPHTMNRRLIAQSGTFAVPGVLDLPLERMLGDADQDNILAKIILPNEVREHGMRELYRMNITYATLFPDLEGLAKSLGYELEFHWGYNPRTHGKVPDVSRLLRGGVRQLALHTAGGNFDAGGPHDAVQKRAAIRVDLEIRVPVDSGHHKSATAALPLDGPSHQARLHVRRFIRRRRRGGRHHGGRGRRHSRGSGRSGDQERRASRVVFRHSVLDVELLAVGPRLDTGKNGMLCVRRRYTPVAHHGSGSAGLVITAHPVQHVLAAGGVVHVSGVVKDHHAHTLLRQGVDLLQTLSGFRIVDLMVGSGVLREEHMLLGRRTVSAAFHHQDSGVRELAHRGDFAGIELRRDVFDVGIVETRFERGEVLLILMPAGGSVILGPGGEDDPLGVGGVRTARKARPLRRAPPDTVSRSWAYSRPILEQLTQLPNATQQNEASTDNLSAMKLLERSGYEHLLIAGICFGE